MGEEEELLVFCYYDDTFWFSAQQTHAQWLVSLTSSATMLLSIDLFPLKMLLY